MYTCTCTSVHSMFINRRLVLKDWCWIICSQYFTNFSFISLFMYNQGRNNTCHVRTYQSDDFLLKFFLSSFMLYFLKVLHVNSKIWRILRNKLSSYSEWSYWFYSFWSIIKNKAGLWKGTFICGESPPFPPPIHFCMTQCLWNE